MPQFGNHHDTEGQRRMDTSVEDGWRESSRTELWAE